MKMRSFSLVIFSLFLGTSFFANADKASTSEIMLSSLKDQQIPNAWLEISQPAFEANIKKLTASLTGNAKLCAIMKADAYGHGLTILMPTIIKNNVPCVGVASNSEIKAVRDAGFEGQLMRVRAATATEVEGALVYDVEELIGNKQVAQQIAKLAQQKGKTIKFHLGLNSTGMSRNGLEVSTEQGLQDAKLITELNGLQIVGIMSHYPVEEINDVKASLAKFNQQTAQVLQTAKLDRSKLQLHIANTFATLESPESHLDLVRAGALLYGDIPASYGYQRILSFKSKVAAVNPYPKGNTVGYDRTFTLTRDSLLANIPVGYSNGYRRVFTNTGHVLIEGQRVPVIGKVSMNTLMIDVTDLKDVKPGDPVVLFGQQGKSQITSEEIEEISGALFTEMYTLWGYSNDKVLVTQ